MAKTSIPHFFIFWSGLCALSEIPLRQEVRQWERGGGESGPDLHTSQCQTHRHTAAIDSSSERHLEAGREERKTLSGLNSSSPGPHIPLGTSRHFNVEMLVIFGWDVDQWDQWDSPTKKGSQKCLQFPMCYHYALNHLKAHPNSNGKTMFDFLFSCHLNVLSLHFQPVQMGIQCQICCTYTATQCLITVLHLIVAQPNYLDCSWNYIKST